MMSDKLLKRIRSNEQLIAKKPKVVGGFLIEDEEDEEDLLLLEEPPRKRQVRCFTNDEVTIGSILSKLTEPSQSHFTENVEPSTRQREETVVNPQISTILEDLLQAPYKANSLSNVTSCGGNEMTVVTEIITCSGQSIQISSRRPAPKVSTEQLVAARSTTKVGRAKKSYYGIPLHELIEEANKDTEKGNLKSYSENSIPSLEKSEATEDSYKSLMWTEKYRAKNFLELVGDSRTHRQVLRWLKSWDPTVFSKSQKSKLSQKTDRDSVEDEKPHRKILLLAGPSGLGKTTLAHVCARQAGYEVIEINASDDRSKGVVNNWIKTSVGTESVKTGSRVKSKSGIDKVHARPMCVVVDEVDGVDNNSSGGGGFVKALIDLCLLDQKNESRLGMSTTFSHSKKKKVDKFRFLRPLILICNDVFHPTLRLLRQSIFAEIIHVKKPSLDAVVTRMKAVFEKEAIMCDEDAVRRLCEVAWEVNSSDSRIGKEGACEGDLRGILIVGEWAAGKLRISKKNGKISRLTRLWVEQNMTNNLSHSGSGSGARGIGRGGAREIVSRVFLEGAGFPKSVTTTSSEKLFNQPKTQLGVSELTKRAGMNRLRELIETNDTDRIVLDIFLQYLSKPFNDDTILSKPNAAYEWFHFYDSCSSQVYSEQKFELVPYLGQPILACHHLFASNARHDKIYAEEYNKKKWDEKDEESKAPHAFTGPRADHEAYEVEKANRATILSFIAGFDATNLRSFRNPAHVATDLLSYLVRILSPGVKPVIVGGTGGRKSMASVRRESEKAIVQRTVSIMRNVGVTFEQGKLESDVIGNPTTLVYRMNPPLDDLIFFETATESTTTSPPVRYTVRQVLDQEYRKLIFTRDNPTKNVPLHRIGKNRQSGHNNLRPSQDASTLDKFSTVPVSQRDFFGRIITDSSKLNALQVQERGKDRTEDPRIWVTFHEGFSDAVKKPLSMDDLLRGL